MPKSSRALALLLEFFEDEYAIAPWLKPWQQAEPQDAKDTGQPVHITEQQWGFTGPAAITWALIQTGEIKYAEPVEAFYPVSFKRRNNLIVNRFTPQDNFTEDTRGVHFWARRMKPRLQEQENNTRRRGSFMHKLLNKHEIDPANAPIPGPVTKLNGDSRDPEFRARLAVEALRGQESIGQLAKNNNVVPKQLREWRAQLISNAVKLFEEQDIDGADRQRHKTSA